VDIVDVNRVNRDVEVAKESLRVEAKALIEAVDRIGYEFLKAVETIFNLKGKLIVTGIGKSGLVGAKIASTLSSTGTSSFFLHPVEALHGDLGMIGEDDGILAISYSGESEEVANILPHIKRFDVPLIAMCANSNSTLSNYADTIIDISVAKEACPLGVAPTASTTLTMALGDAIAVALMRRRGFKERDFASFHPGGSLGKRLFVKVSDIMKRDTLPVVESSITLRDAIFSMSQGKLGNILITKDNRLVAIMSDGDLRRALMREDFNLDSSVMLYATLSPKVLRDENTLATEALLIMEKLKIQLMPIVDDEWRVKGVVHIHDLISAGIKKKK
jgi:arabinose-5-phosphate isomerase